MKQKETEKLKCPYCKEPQYYVAKDYFTIAGGLSFNVICSSCDHKFNCMREDGYVTSYSNLTTLPPNRE